MPRGASLEIRVQVWTDTEAAPMQIIMQFISEPLKLFPTQLVERMASCMTIETLEQQAVVYHSGDEPLNFYVVLLGTLQRTKTLIYRGVRYAPSSRPAFCLSSM